MRIVKRDGRKVDFDKDKIFTAIQNVFREYNRFDEDVVLELTNDVANQVEAEMNVEEIQDIVENTLIEAGFTKLAKAYIKYRESKNKVRKDKYKKDGLDKDFLSEYKHKDMPFPTELGKFIYYRTYSRWLPEEQRREYWWETAKRAVEYNTSLAPTSQKEKQELFDRIYNFKNFLAGRTLWTGGTEASRKYPMSNYNCSFTVIDEFKAYEDLFYLLMIGAGVGVRVLYRDVEKLPPVRTNVNLSHEYYTPRPKSEREELTSYSFENDNSTIKIYVGDSKEGKQSCPSYQ